MVTKLAAMIGKGHGTKAWVIFWLIYSVTPSVIIIRAQAEKGQASGLSTVNLKLVRSSYS